MWLRLVGEVNAGVRALLLRPQCRFKGGEGIFQPPLLLCHPHCAHERPIRSVGSSKKVKFTAFVRSPNPRRKAEITINTYATLQSAAQAGASRLIFKRAYHYTALPLDFEARYLRPVLEVPPTAPIVRPIDGTKQKISPLFRVLPSLRGAGAGLPDDSAAARGTNREREICLNVRRVHRNFLLMLLCCVFSLWFSSFVTAMVVKAGVGWRGVIARAVTGISSRESLQALV